MVPLRIAAVNGILSSGDISDSTAVRNVRSSTNHKFLRSHRECDVGDTFQVEGGVLIFGIRHCLCRRNLLSVKMCCRRTVLYVVSACLLVSPEFALRFLDSRLDTDGIPRDAQRIADGLSREMQAILGCFSLEGGIIIVAHTITDCLTQVPQHRFSLFL